MGILFGLTFVMSFIGGAAVAVILLIEWWYRRRAKRHGREILPAKPVAIAIYSIALMTYGWAALIGYGLWCEDVRHVDMGIGDTWMVPIESRYSLLLVDTTNDGSLEKDGSAIIGQDSSGRPAVVSEVTDLTLNDGKIIGRDSAGEFVLDMTTGQLRRSQEFGASTQELVSKANLESVYSFYYERRWNWLDLEAFGLICLPPIGLLVFWYRHLVRRNRVSVILPQ